MGEHGVQNRLWNRRFVHLLLMEAFLQMGGFLTRPIISNYAVDLGATVPLAGFLAGMMATSALLCRPFSGAIADRFSKKTLLVASCALFCAGAFGCSLAKTPAVVGTFLALQGVAFAFKSAIIVSLVPSSVPDRRIGAAVGWLGMAYTLAIALGPAIGSAVGSAWGYGASFAVSGVLLAYAFVLALLFRFPDESQDAFALEGAAGETGDLSAARDSKSAVLEGAEGIECELVDAEAAAGGEAGSGAGLLPSEKRPASGAGPSPDAGRARSFASLLPGPGKARRSESPSPGEKRTGRFAGSMVGSFLYAPVIPLSIIAGMLMVAQGITSSFVVMASEMRGSDAGALYFLAYSLSTLAARPLAGHASDRWGVSKVVPPMMVVAALAMLSLAFADSAGGVVLGGLLMGCGQGSAYAAIQAESVRGVPSGQLGRSSNTFFIGPDLSMGLGPIAGGWFLQMYGPRAMFLFCAVSVACALALFAAITVRRACRKGESA